MPTVDLISTIESDFESSNVLKELLKKSCSFSSENFSTLMKATANIESDFEKASVLDQIIESKNLSLDQHWMALLHETSTIESSYEKENILSKIAEKMPKNESIYSLFRIIAKTLEDDAAFGKLTRKLDQ
jgi:hypothetical protein